MLLRALVAVFALLALGWLGVLYRDVRLGQAAADVFYTVPDPSAAEIDRNLERLQDAELLNPGRNWEAMRVSFLVLSGRERQALEAGNRLVRKEPENVGAWIILLRAAQGVEPQRARQAAAEIRRLNPWSAREPR